MCFIENKRRVLYIRIQIKRDWVLQIIQHPTGVNVVVGAFDDALEIKEFITCKSM